MVGYNENLKPCALQRIRDKNEQTCWEERVRESNLPQTYACLWEKFEGGEGISIVCAQQKYSASPHEKNMTHLMILLSVAGLLSI